MVYVCDLRKKVIPWVVLIIFVGFFLPSSGWPTTYIPISVEQQLKESTGVVHGKFVDSSYKKLPDGMVVTQANFEVINISGIHLKNSQKISVIYPGGIWNDVVHYVHGGPKFKVGEEVVLIVSKRSSNVWLHNLAMGKYNIKIEDGIKMLKNEVIPEGHPYRKITFDNFKNLVGDISGIPLRPPSYNKVVINIPRKETKRKSVESYSYAGETKFRKKKDRRPASEEKAKEEKESNNLGMSWLIILFALLGAAHSLMKKRGLG